MVGLKRGRVIRPHGDTNELGEWYLMRNDRLEVATLHPRVFAEQPSVWPRPWRGRVVGWPVG